jgi:hypothetical protein
VVAKAHEQTGAGAAPGASDETEGTKTALRPKVALSELTASASTRRVMPEPSGGSSSAGGASESELLCPITATSSAHEHELRAAEHVVA